MCAFGAKLSEYSAICLLTSISTLMCDLVFLSLSLHAGWVSNFLRARTLLMLDCHFSTASNVLMQQIFVVHQLFTGSYPVIWESVFWEGPPAWLRSFCREDSFPPIVSSPFLGGATLHKIAFCLFENIKKNCAGSWVSRTLIFVLFGLVTITLIFVLFGLVTIEVSCLHKFCFLFFESIYFSHVCGFFREVNNSWHVCWRYCMQIVLPFCRILFFSKCFSHPFRQKKRGKYWFLRPTIRRDSRLNPVARGRAPRHPMHLYHSPW